jgi:hypothetical protein
MSTFQQMKADEGENGDTVPIKYQCDRYRYDLELYDMP